MRLAPAFKVKLRTARNGTPAAAGPEVVKLTVTHANLVAAFSAVNPVKDFVEQLQSMLPRARAGARCTDAGNQSSVDHAALRNLEIMGFERQRASCALQACDNSSQRAVQWLFDHQSLATAELLEQVSGHRQAQPSGDAAGAHMHAHL